MKTTTVLLSFLALAAVALVVQGQPADSPDETTSGKEEQIKSLLIERRDTLRQIVNLLTEQYKVGEPVSFAAIIKTENCLLEAELELAKARQERVRLYKEKIENLRKLEQLLVARHDNGGVTQDQVLQAKAARLAAEIELLRAQANGG